MNYKLSCVAVRVDKKCGYILESNGKILSSNIFPFKGDNIKNNSIEALTKGLRAAKQKVNHDDILVIVLQNNHLVDWLSGNIEYKGYEEPLDKAFEVLESIDCRYMFVQSNMGNIVDFVKNSDITKPKVSSVDSAFKDLL